MQLQGSSGKAGGFASEGNSPIYSYCGVFVGEYFR